MRLIREGAPPSKKQWSHTDRRYTFLVDDISTWYGVVFDEDDNEYLKKAYGPIWRFDRPVTVHPPDTLTIQFQLNEVYEFLMGSK